MAHPKVVKGRIIKDAKNKDRGDFSAAPSKWAGAVWVENEDGGNERCWLLTESDIAKLDKRAAKNKEDAPRRGFITDLLD